jgi:WD40 repeat protein
MRIPSTRIDQHNVGSITELARFEDSSQITKLVCHPNGKWLIVAGYWQVNVWDIESEHLIRTVKISGADKPFYLLSPDKNLLASFDGNKYQFDSMWIVDLRTGEEIFRRKLVPVGFNSHGTEIAVKGYHNDSHVYYAVNINNGELRLLYEYEGGTYGELSPDWRYVTITGLNAKSFQICETETNRVLVDIYHGSPVYESVQFMEDSRHIIMVFGERGSTQIDSYLWNLDSRQELVKFSSEDHEQAVRLSPDKKILLIASDGTVKCLDVLTNTFLGSVDIQYPSGLVFDPNNSALIINANFYEGSRTEKSLLKIYDIPTLQPLGILSSFSSYVGDVVFNNEGTLVLASDHTNGIRVWGLPN